MFEDLPGGEILREGLADLEAGRRSASALLVLAAAPRLTRCGVKIPEIEPGRSFPEHELYDLLEAQHGAAAYGMYGSLMRRFVSLERALEINATAGRDRAARASADPDPTAKPALSGS